MYFFSSSVIHGCVEGGDLTKNNQGINHKKPKTPTIININFQLKYIVKNAIKGIEIIPPIAAPELKTP